MQVLKRFLDTLYIYGNIMRLVDKTCVNQRWIKRNQQEHDVLFTFVGTGSRCEMAACIRGPRSVQDSLHKSHNVQYKSIIQVL